MDLLECYDDVLSPCSEGSDSQGVTKEGAKPEAINSVDRGSSIESVPLEDIASLVQVRPPPLGESDRIETFGELDGIDLAEFDVPVTTV